MSPIYDVMLQELKSYLHISDKEMEAIYNTRIYEDFSVQKGLAGLSGSLFENTDFYSLSAA